MPTTLLCLNVDGGSRQSSMNPRTSNSDFFHVTDTIKNRVCYENTCEVGVRYLISPYRKITPIDMYRCLLKVYGDQTKDVVIIKRR